MTEIFIVNVVSTPTNVTSCDYTSISLKFFYLFLFLISWKVEKSWESGLLLGIQVHQGLWATWKTCFSPPAFPACLLTGRMSQTVGDTGSEML